MVVQIRNGCIDKEWLYIGNGFLLTGKKNCRPAFIFVSDSILGLSGLFCATRHLITSTTYFMTIEKDLLRNTHFGPVTLLILTNMIGAEFATFLTIVTKAKKAMHKRSYNVSIIKIYANIYSMKS